MEAQMNISNILWNRLKPREEEKESMTSEKKLREQNSKSTAIVSNKNKVSQDLNRNISRSSFGGSNKENISFNEWLKNKDAERRLKRKLIEQAQDHVREELL